MTRSRRRLYRRTGTALLRAAVNLSAPALGAWPGPGTDGEHWRSWIAPVWADESFRRTVSVASPDLADRVEALLTCQSADRRRARRAALALARYALRYAHRSTPFGLFAGVAPVDFGSVDPCPVGSGQAAVVRFGHQHQVVARTDPKALDARITAMEADSGLMADVEVCVNTLARVHGGRLHIPAEGAAAFSLALTPVVALVLKTAATPITHAELLGKLAAEFPETGRRQRERLVADLLRTRLLRSALRAPATIVDPAATLTSAPFTTLGAPFLTTSAFPPSALTTDALTRDARDGDERTALDVRLDATVHLPETVAVELETAATVLARLATCPTGTGSWRRYIERFADRYGEGAEVSVEQLTDPEHGLGLPEGFDEVDEPPRPMSRRDRLLLELAGTAALEGRRAVTLSETVVEEIEAASGGPPPIPAPHFEVCAHVQASSLSALERGDFRVRVHTVSRAAGTMTGRFWHLFPHAAAGYTTLPTVSPGARLAQLSFHPSRVEADLLTRAPQVLPTLVSVGEFRNGKERVLYPSGLVVGLRDGHLYLAVAATGERIELLTPTAINFVWNNFTPPLVRFLAELSRAATPQVTWFDWGAAWTLPFTPALHYRRTIVVAARWQLKARTLPGRAASQREWAEQLHAWRTRAGVPDRILLAVDDQQLLLNLSHDMDLDLLRTHLLGAPVAVLYDAPPPEADGWIGGRAHSIVVPMRSHP
ncbi:lantibiotic dehydratase family protein [Sphaerisporangium sp. NPDC051017]|uniref:lantibiotic dehydratase family protein n=1 Tax=Sphaerisporangium sp. NPDC051017 TaxID=3154636 RepID=UPI003449D29D